ncbi:malic enzyme-like NAD(P)-binding protein [Streptomyces atratus]|uniref:malic enzyme-like NAD(P)-binding protein n=1 Tax=Streptomyces atratus TaxID=1893 RepID=UPI00224CB1B5|nr:malic enzyme-like NAD(P)-binding protein [Streptomyces atratus]MCX5338869.1 hypothetical protein [Streptomyces atratus]
MPMHMPSVLLEPLANHGSAFTAEERERLGLVGRLPGAVLVRHVIGQANNALLYPGLGLGTVVAGAARLTAGMLLAAAEAVAGQVDARAPGAPLLPPVANLRASSATVAVAVARAAVQDKVATRQPADLVQAVQDVMWQPVYGPPSEKEASQ